MASWGALSSPFVSISARQVQCHLDQYTARLTLQTPDDGAALVGVADAGGYLAAANVEAALQEIGAVLATKLVAFSIGTFAAESGNARAATVQLRNGFGNALSAVKNLRIRVWDTAPFDSAAGTATLSLTGGGVGVVVSGSASADMVVTTNASGAFSLTVSDAVAETVYVTVEISLEDATRAAANSGVFFAGAGLASVVFA